MRCNRPTLPPYQCTGSERIELSFSVLETDVLPLNQLPIVREVNFLWHGNYSRNSISCQANYERKFGYCYSSTFYIARSISTIKEGVITKHPLPIIQVWKLTWYYIPLKQGKALKRTWTANQLITKQLLYHWATKAKMVIVFETTLLLVSQFCETYHVIHFRTLKGYVITKHNLPILKVLVTS